MGCPFQLFRFKNHSLKLTRSKSAKGRAIHSTPRPHILLFTGIILIISQCAMQAGCGVLATIPHPFFHYMVTQNSANMNTLKGGINNPLPFLNSSNVYEVNVRQYTDEGTLNAFKEHIPRLKDMGVEILWFMPLTPIAVKGRKGSLGSNYACSDYTKISSEFGTEEDFKQLVQYAHSLGFKVIIDWVANHTGQDHTWTTTNPDYYIKNEQNQFYDKYGWDDVYDLDYRNPHLTDAMQASMKFWIDTFNIDGFRCDMAHLVPLSFWQSARLNLDSIKELIWIAETQNVEYYNVFDSLYNWELLHSFEDVAKGRATAAVLEKNIKHQHSNPLKLPLNFLTNHDENSHSGSEYERLEGFVSCAQIYSILNPGLPLIYSGQELPNKKSLAFFDKDPIEWNYTYMNSGFIKKLFELRKVIFSNDNFKIETLETDNNNILSYSIVYNITNRVIILLNTTNSNQWMNASDIQENIYTDYFTKNTINIKNDRWYEIEKYGYWVLE